MDKPEGKRLVVRPRCRLYGSTKIYLKEREWKDVDIIKRAPDTNKWWALVKSH